MREGQLYQHDIATLKKYREDYWRIILLKSARKSGYEQKEQGYRKKNSAGHEEKLEASLSRTRSRVFELAVCNPWNWFVTMTLNPELHDRTDLEKYSRDISLFIKNYNHSYKTEIKYLLIPELHSDGVSWHIHGLMMGLPRNHLTAFSLKDKIPYRIRKEIVNGTTVYDWAAYRENFGYISISEIRNAESVSKYITKYITKELYHTGVGLNKHLYYCSHGLNRAETIHKGFLACDLEEDYANEYVKIKTVRSYEEGIKYFEKE